MKPMRCIRYYIILGFWFNCFTCFSGYTKEITHERLELIHADEFNQKVINGKVIRKLKGDVYFRQGNAHLFCYGATWFIDEERVLLETDVKIDDGEKVLTADFVTYYGKLQQEEAHGNVKIVDSVRTLEADQVVFFEIEDKAVADRNVKIVDTENQFILTGGHSEYFRSNDSVIVTINPVLVQTDSVGAEDLRITGNVMTLTQNGERAWVTDNVIITKDSTEARCGEAEYLRQSNKVILLDNPRVWQKDQHLQGDTIEIYSNNQQIEQVHVLGNAVVISDVDSLVLAGHQDRLSGQKMTIYINQNEIEKIIIEDQATSWYHIIEDDQYKGLNKVMGDKLSLFLSEGEIKRIVIESEPGVSSGVFYPPGKEQYSIPESGKDLGKQAANRIPAKGKSL